MLLNQKIGKIHRLSAPGPRWGRRPQAPFTLLRDWHWLRGNGPILDFGGYRRLPPRSDNDSGGTPSGVQGAEPPGRRNQFGYLRAVNGGYSGMAASRRDELS